MGDSKIGWTDAVWDPMTGCSPVSRGCDNCYAERMATRLARMGASGYAEGDPFAPRVQWDRLGEPARWRKPRRVFICSMGDWLHELQTPGMAQEVLEYATHPKVRAGGESGPGHRPMDDAWARSLRDQCSRAGVPFYFKQRPGPRPGVNRVLDGRTWDGGPRP